MIRTRIILPFLFLAALATVSRGGIYLSLDLDSLTARSTAIVEAELLKTEVSGLAQFRVTKVLAGTLKEDDDITVSGISSYYEKPLEDRARSFTYQSRPLAAGNRFFLFLAQDDNDKDKVSLYLRGIKLITDKGVAGFRQWMNPGPAVADLDPSDKKPLPSVEEFRASIAESIRITKAFPEEFKSAGHDGIKLLALLKSRAARPQSSVNWGIDVLADQVADALAELYDPALSDAALSIKDLRGDGHLRWSFSTPRGRSYLLDKISDKNVSTKDRTRYITLIYYSGPRLADDASKPDANAPAIAGNGNYVRQLAQVAADNVKAPAFFHELISTLSTWTVKGAKAEVTEDLRAAMVILQKLRTQFTDADTRYTLENALYHMDPAAYTALESPCGPVISMLTFYEGTPEDKKRGLLYRYFAQPTNNLHYDIKIVLQPVQGGNAFEVTDSAMKTQPNINILALPANLPHGRYRVFARFYGERGVVGESYGFQTDL